jgi:hypothetical protein
MKSIVNFFLVLLLLSGCTHRIVRTGYQTGKSDYSDCNIAITRFMQVTDSVLKIGEIKLGESGFSVACSESHAIQILKNEGCAIQADLINIVEENRPDLWSSCYRCRAEFYKFKNSPVKIQSDHSYYPENVSTRVSRDRSRNTALAVAGGVLGIVLGYLISR